MEKQNKRKALKDNAPEQMRDNSGLPDIETLLNQRLENEGVLKKCLNSIRHRIASWKFNILPNPADNPEQIEMMSQSEFDVLMSKAKPRQKSIRNQSYNGDITESSAYSVLQAFFMEIHGKTDMSSWDKAGKPDFTTQHQPFAQAYSSAQTAFLRICEPFSYVRMNITSSPILIDNLIALRLREFRFPDLEDLGCLGNIEMEADCLAFADNSMLVRFFLPTSHSEALSRHLQSEYGRMAAFILEHHKQQTRMLAYYRGDGREKDEQILSEQGMSMLKITNLSYWAAYHMLLAGLENGVLMGVIDGTDMENHINHYEIIGLHRSKAWKRNKKGKYQDSADWVSKGLVFEEFSLLYQFLKKNNMLNPIMRLGMKK